MNLSESLPADCAERYAALEPIERGGFGTVWAALQLSLSRDVAIKVLHAHALSDPEQVARFLEEPRIAASVRHPNVVQVLDCGAGAGVPWVAYELIRGRTLRALLDAGPVSIATVLDVALAVASGLEAAHAAGVVHRDIKPENILLGPDGRFLIADFGISRWEHRTGVETAAGMILGTPAYLAPETITNGAVGDPADAYALGVTLFELIEGHLPFVSDDVAMLLDSHVRHRPPPLSRADTPRRLATVVEGLLAKAPESRLEVAEVVRQLAAPFQDHLAPAHVGRPSPRRGPSGARTVISGRGDAAVPHRVPLGRLPLVAGILATAVLAVWNSPGGPDPVHRYPTPSGAADRAEGSRSAPIPEPRAERISDTEWNRLGAPCTERQSLGSMKASELAVDLLRKLRQHLQAHEIGPVTPADWLALLDRVEVVSGWLRCLRNVGGSAPAAILTSLYADLKRLPADTISPLVGDAATLWLRHADLGFRNSDDLCASLAKLDERVGLLIRDRSIVPSREFWASVLRMRSRAYLLDRGDLDPSADGSRKARAASRVRGALDLWRTSLSALLAGHADHDELCQSLTEELAKHFLYLADSPVASVEEIRAAHGAYRQLLDHVQTGEDSVRLRTDLHGERERTNRSLASRFPGQATIPRF